MIKKIFLTKEKSRLKPISNDNKNYLVDIALDYDFNIKQLNLLFHLPPLNDTHSQVVIKNYDGSFSESLINISNNFKNSYYCLRDYGNYEFSIIYRLAKDRLSTGLVNHNRFFTSNQSNSMINDKTNTRNLSIVSNTRIGNNYNLNINNNASNNNEYTQFNQLNYSNYSNNRNNSNFEITNHNKKLSLLNQMELLKEIGKKINSSKKYNKNKIMNSNNNNDDSYVLLSKFKNNYNDNNDIRNINKDVDSNDKSNTNHLKNQTMIINNNINNTSFIMGLNTLNFNDNNFRNTNINGVNDIDNESINSNSNANPNSITPGSFKSKYSSSILSLNNNNNNNNSIIIDNSSNIKNEAYNHKRYHTSIPVDYKTEINLNNTNNTNVNTNNVMNFRNLNSINTLTSINTLNTINSIKSGNSTNNNNNKINRISPYSYCKSNIKIHNNEYSNTNKNNETKIDNINNLNCSSNLINSNNTRENILYNNPSNSPVKKITSLNNSLYNYNDISSTNNNISVINLNKIRSISSINSELSNNFTNNNNNTIIGIGNNNDSIRACLLTSDKFKISNDVICHINNSSNNTINKEIFDKKISNNSNISKFSNHTNNTNHTINNTANFKGVKLKDNSSSITVNDIYKCNEESYINNKIDNVENYLNTKNSEVIYTNESLSNLSFAINDNKTDLSSVITMSDDNRIDTVRNNSSKSNKNDNSDKIKVRYGGKASNKKLNTNTNPINKIKNSTDKNNTTDIKIIERINKNKDKKSSLFSNSGASKKNSDTRNIKNADNSKINMLDHDMRGANKISSNTNTNSNTNNDIVTKQLLSKNHNALYSTPSFSNTFNNLHNFTNNINNLNYINLINTNTTSNSNNNVNFFNNNSNNINDSYTNIDVEEVMTPSIGIGKNKNNSTNKKSYYTTAENTVNNNCFNLISNKKNNSDIDNNAHDIAYNHNHNPSKCHRKSSIRKSEIKAKMHKKVTFGSARDSFDFRKDSISNSPLTSQSSNSSIVNNNENNNNNKKNNSSSNNNVIIMNTETSNDKKLSDRSSINLHHNNIFRKNCNFSSESEDNSSKSNSKNNNSQNSNDANNTNNYLTNSNNTSRTSDSECNYNKNKYHKNYNRLNSINNSNNYNTNSYYTNDSHEDEEDEGYYNSENSSQSECYYTDSQSYDSDGETYYNNDDDDEDNINNYNNNKDCDNSFEENNHRLLRVVKQNLSQRFIDSSISEHDSQSEKDAKDFMDIKKISKFNLSSSNRVNNKMLNKIKLNNDKEREGICSNSNNNSNTGNNHELVNKMSNNTANLIVGKKSSLLNAVNSHNNTNNLKNIFKNSPIKKIKRVQTSTNIKLSMLNKNKTSEKIVKSSNNSNSNSNNNTINLAPSTNKKLSLISCSSNTSKNNDERKNSRTGFTNKTDNINNKIIINAKAKHSSKTNNTNTNNIKLHSFNNNNDNNESNNKKSFGHEKNKHNTTTFFLSTKSTNNDLRDNINDTNSNIYNNDKAVLDSKDESVIDKEKRNSKKQTKFKMVSKASNKSLKNNDSNDNNDKNNLSNKQRLYQRSITSKNVSNLLSINPILEIDQEQEFANNNNTNSLKHIAKVSSNTENINLDNQKKKKNVNYSNNDDNDNKLNSTTNPTGSFKNIKEINLNTSNTSKSPNDFNNNSDTTNLTNQKITHKYYNPETTQKDKKEKTNELQKQMLQKQTFFEINDFPLEKKLLTQLKNEEKGIYIYLKKKYMQELEPLFEDYKTTQNKKKFFKEVKSLIDFVLTNEIYDKLNTNELSILKEGLRKRNKMFVNVFVFFSRHLSRMKLLSHLRKTIEIYQKKTDKKKEKEEKEKEDRKVLEEFIWELNCVCNESDLERQYENNNKDNHDINDNDKCAKISSLDKNTYVKNRRNVEKWINLKKEKKDMRFLICNKIVDKTNDHFLTRKMKDDVNYNMAGLYNNKNEGIKQIGELEHNFELKINNNDNTSHSNNNNQPRSTSLPNKQSPNQTQSKSNDITINTIKDYKQYKSSRHLNRNTLFTSYNIINFDQLNTKKEKNYFGDSLLDGTDIYLYSFSEEEDNLLKESFCETLLTTNYLTIDEKNTFKHIVRNKRKEIFYLLVRYEELNRDFSKTFSAVKELIALYKENKLEKILDDSDSVIITVSQNHVKNSFASGDSQVSINGINAYNGNRNRKNKRNKFKTVDYKNVSPITSKGSIKMCSNCKLPYKNISTLNNYINIGVNDGNINSNVDGNNIINNNAVGANTLNVGYSNIGFGFLKQNSSVNKRKVDEAFSNDTSDANNVNKKLKENSEVQETCKCPVKKQTNVQSQSKLTIPHNNLHVAYNNSISTNNIINQNPLSSTKSSQKLKQELNPDKHQHQQQKHSRSQLRYKTINPANMPFKNINVNVLKELKELKQKKRKMSSVNRHDTKSNSNINNIHTSNNNNSNENIKNYIINKNCSNSNKYLKSVIKKSSNKLFLEDINRKKNNSNTGNLSKFSHNKNTLNFNTNNNSINSNNNSSSSKFINNDLSNKNKTDIHIIELSTAKSIEFEEISSNLIKNNDNDFIKRINKENSCNSNFSINDINEVSEVNEIPSKCESANLYTIKITNFDDEGNTNISNVKENKDNDNSNNNDNSSYNNRTYNLSSLKNKKSNNDIEKYISNNKKKNYDYDNYNEKENKRSILESSMSNKECFVDDYNNKITIKINKPIENKGDENSNNNSIKTSKNNSVKVGHDQLDEYKFLSGNSNFNNKIILKNNNNSNNSTKKNTRSNLKSKTNESGAIFKFTDHLLIDSNNNNNITNQKLPLLNNNNDSTNKIFNDSKINSINNTKNLNNSIHSVYSINNNNSLNNLDLNNSVGNKIDKNNNNTSNLEPLEKVNSKNKKITFMLKKSRTISRIDNKTNFMSTNTKANNNISKHVNPKLKHKNSNKFSSDSINSKESQDKRKEKPTTILKLLKRRKMKMISKKNSRKLIRDHSKIMKENLDFDRANSYLEDFNTNNKKTLNSIHINNSNNALSINTKTRSSVFKDNKKRKQSMNKSTNKSISNIPTNTNINTNINTNTTNITTNINSNVKKDSKIKKSKKKHKKNNNSSQLLSLNINNRHNSFFVKASQNTNNINNINNNETIDITNINNNMNIHFNNNNENVDDDLDIMRNHSNNVYACNIQNKLLISNYNSNIKNNTTRSNLNSKKESKLNNTKVLKILRNHKKSNTSKTESSREVLFKSLYVINILKQEEFSITNQDIIKLIFYNNSELVKNNFKSIQHKLVKLFDYYEKINNNINNNTNTNTNATDTFGVSNTHTDINTNTNTISNPHIVNYYIEIKQECFKLIKQTTSTVFMNNIEIINLTREKTESDSKDSSFNDDVISFLQKLETLKEDKEEILNNNKENEKTNNNSSKSLNSIQNNLDFYPTNKGINDAFTFKEILVLLVMIIKQEDFTLFNIYFDNIYSKISDEMFIFKMKELIREVFGSFVNENRNNNEIDYSTGNLINFSNSNKSNDEDSNKFDFSRNNTLSTSKLKEISIRNDLGNNNNNTISNNNNNVFGYTTFKKDTFSKSMSINEINNSNVNSNVNSNNNNTNNYDTCTSINEKLIVHQMRLIKKYFPHSYNILIRFKDKVLNSIHNVINNPHLNNKNNNTKNINNISMSNEEKESDILNKVIHSFMKEFLNSNSEVINLNISETISITTNNIDQLNLNNQKFSSSMKTKNKKDDLIMMMINLEFELGENEYVENKLLDLLNTIYPSEE